ncbi:flagellar basal body rod protein [Neobacillus sp. MM2021_6]|uniref:lmo0954 family membrane protein n=1 Tax=Bacillaceae TaxID=186817 RepID=UPI00140C6FFD|nr:MULTISPECIES: flagellar basal body rod protein [Bacillaceae]MBO0961691.1 flagellar basal body rod protein [Neobacillus sp. MM2021_6]NHC18282.1 flagellar basal body rod protein [Bacillus sp. MM2020_4]
MKKFGLLVAGGLAAIILLKTIGPMVGLLVSLAILYFIFKQFLKTESLGMKIGLIIIGLLVLSTTIHHIPALIGVGAAYVLYLVYKNWNNNKKTAAKNEMDPFVSFENQWNELKK